MKGKELPQALSKFTSPNRTWEPNSGKAAIH
jgi:hypothetical protein